MRREPISNDPNSPLVSVLVYNYYGEYLGRCFDRILTQNVLDNIEVIFIDNTLIDGSWDIAMEYARKYPGVMTIKRNKRSGEIGELDDLTHCLLMAKGKYYVPLSRDDAFLPEYVKQCVQTMESDPLANFELVKRRTTNPIKPPNIENRPLVSVLIHNYNYGRYLRQCLDSVFNQTYDHIEICFSDNASSDDSWDIAVEYARKYKGKMTIIRNRTNFGPSINFENCYYNIRGKYFCALCSDDALMPEYIQKCVLALEAYPDSGFAMTHRAIIDERGSQSEEPPFYNQSCLIPGPEQAAVYMMAAVNPSISQIMYVRSKGGQSLSQGNFLSRWFAQRIIDFSLCCEYPMVYIKEPLLLNRVHSNSDSYRMANSLVEVFGQYMLLHQFTEIASSKGNMAKVIGRLPMSLGKLSGLCLRYCARSLCSRDEECARRYFHLAIAIQPDITGDAIFGKIAEYWGADSSEKAKIIKSLESSENLITRRISYDPPEGSIPIQVTLGEG